MTALSRLARVATGKEAAFGSPAAPAIAWPFTTINVADTIVEGSDAGWRSVPVAQVGLLPVGLSSGHQLAGPVLADSVGVPLAGVLGDVQFAAGSPNTWTMALLNTGAQPPSNTLTVTDPVGGLQWPGLRWKELALTWDPAQLLTCTASAAGLPAATWTGSMPATAETPLPGWVGTATIAGSADVTLLSATVRLQRAVTAKTNTDGSLVPYLQRAGVLAVTGDLKWLCLSDTYRQDAVNGTALALALSWSQGSGAALRSLTVRCSQVKLTTAPRDYGGKYVRLSSSFTAVPNASDAGASGGLSPVLVTLRNALGSGSY